MQLDWTSLPYQRSSGTSKAAAVRMVPRAGSIAASVYGYICEQCEHGATREEIQLALKMRIQSVCSAVNGLLRRGLIEKHGERETTTGNAAEVLVRIEG